MAGFSVGTSNALTFKQHLSKIFATEAEQNNPLEVQGMMGDDENSVIQVLNNELDEGGDKITYHLLMNFTGAGFDGDDGAEGNEEPMVLYEDSVLVQYKKFATRINGVMTNQRTKLKLRPLAIGRLANQAAEWKSWLAVTMLAGKVGTNVKILPTSFTGFGGNTLTDVDSTHLMYGGDATAKADLDAADTFDVADLARLRAKARSLSPKIRPIKIKGREFFIVLVHPDVARDLKTSTATLNWGDVEKAMLSGGQDPKLNGLINAALGIRDGCILVECDQCPIYTDYGAGSNVRASRVLFLGAQAGVWAKGRKEQKVEWEYVEKKFQYDEQTGIKAGTVAGFKPTIFNSKRYAMLAMDVACAAS